ncbi:hypothetical protein [Aurantiacibacter aquimixticola]|uniref:Envelope stress response membrane protein PspB n=1 Tax=Aurantiacibacter aquimixticola TaxID=1958945 RepID=A0A419RQP5_9SPHN|nr:hypothetical protein [Aurantiacibacter aquimixticola]RJY08087.1 hypothetical protein D6201_00780 [Aurantiacibacter aquimixticola]
MSFWTMLFLLALAGIAYSIWTRRHDSAQGIVRDSRGDPLPPANTEREAELQNEVEQLRERVKVLERIATDPSRRTAEEIEKLRDKD